MSGLVGKVGSVVVAGTILLLSQGCSKDWMQSDGKKMEAKTPSLSGGSSSGELTGFSRNPAEERIGHSGYSASTTPSGLTAQQRAELSKEEKAAIEAGLQDVFFGYDQWAVSDAGMTALDRDAAYLKDHPNAVLKIEGHCDERGAGDYNMVLGDKRAKAARNYLIEAGVSA